MTRKRLEAVDLNFYALSKDGEYAGGSLWGPADTPVRGFHGRRAPATWNSRCILYERSSAEANIRLQGFRCIGLSGIAALVDTVKQIFAFCIR